MWNTTMQYSENRGTWNVFVDNEWYYEGTYEQCCTVMDSFVEEEDEYWEDEYETYEDVEDEWEDTTDLGYESNCHCDTYGVCGGPSCPNYFKCQAQ